MNAFALVLGISAIAAGQGIIDTNNRKVIGTLFRWQKIDFDFPTPRDRQAAINTGQFIPENVVPLGIERWRERIFVSTPAWKKGIPFTLSVVPIQDENTSPPFIPYPSWHWHTAENCTGFTSVFRMAIDHCGLMWVLDSGQVGGFETPQQLCPPTLFAIDLKTDAVIGKYVIPPQLVLQHSLITNIIVDSRDAQCRDLHVYISDVRRFGIIVFRASDAAFWRFSHYTFYPEPLKSNYTLHGVNFQWTDGVFGMALGKYTDGERPLYYHALSSNREFVVNTSVLRNPARVDDSVDEFRLFGDSRGEKGQVASSVVDRNGVMFYSLVSQDSIGCWDTRRPYVASNREIVAHNNNTLIFPNDMRLDHEVKQYAWIITNRLPMYQFNLLNFDDYNFRVLYLDPAIAIDKSNVCKVSSIHEIGGY